MPLACLNKYARKACHICSVTLHFQAVTVSPICDKDQKYHGETADQTLHKASLHCWS